MDENTVLFVNSCVRKESRTKVLADLLLKKKDPVCEVFLQDVDFPKTDENFLKKRDKLIAEGRFDDQIFSLARQFASAKEIVIAAPLWDLSFPASLKQYFEQINVVGVTFCYGPDGLPKGLCKAKKLTYVTTCGGDFFPEEFGFGYVKALAENFYGIGKVELIKAVGLDVEGRDEKAILDTAFKAIFMKETEENNEKTTKKNK